MATNVDKEIEYVRGVVAARFPVYETRVTPQAVQFLVTVDPATMEAKFEDLRKELVPKDYIPALTKEGGEHVILVQRRPPQRFVNARVNLLLFALTVATTLWAGAVLWAGYEDIDWLSLRAWGMGGLAFTLPLLTILGVHEMGHYVVAKRHQVKASLPFFIPAPILPLGTFGAMISMRDPLPNRKALLDIGASGPILGLLTAIPVTLIGFFLMGANPRPLPVNSGGGLGINLPELYRVLQYFVPIPNDALLHPTAFAGWVGLFVTALNLLPAGQLDGGHVARAVLGDNAKFVSWGFLGFMFLLGLFYPGWFIIGVFILLLGARHPPPLNDLVRIDAKRYGIAAAATAVMLLSFVAIPVFEIPAEAGVQFEAVAMPDVGVTNLTATVANQSTASFAFVVRNVGNVRTNVSLSLDLDNFARGNLNVTFTGVTVGNQSANVTATGSWFYLDTNATANVTLLLDATRYPLAPGFWIFHVNAHGDPDSLPEFDRSLRIDLTVAP